MTLLKLINSLKTKRLLIIGEKTALFFKQKNNNDYKIIIKSPKDVDQIKKYCTVTPLEIYIDFPGANYTLNKLPKLSRLELKQAISNHPDLQDKKLIAASAYLTKDQKLNISLLKNNDFLTPWLDALNTHKIPFSALVSLPFHQAHSLPNTPTKATYWVTQTHDKTARHVCIINNAVIFVRYTPLTDTINDEIKKTLQFIQHDYAIDFSDITTITHLDSPLTPTLSEPKKIFNWIWFKHFPKTYSTSFQFFQKDRKQRKVTKYLKMSSMAILFLSTAFLLNKGFLYHNANESYEHIVLSHKNLPNNVKDLSIEALKKLIFIAQNNQYPLQIISTFQEKTPPEMQLEEFYIKSIKDHKHLLRVAIRHQDTLTKQDNTDHLEMIFNILPKDLPSDQYVDRFEIVFPEGLIQ